jgi:hypothetical protein
MKQGTLDIGLKRHLDAVAALGQCRSPITQNCQNKQATDHPVQNPHSANLSAAGYTSEYRQNL